ncbi:hypothetical protein P7K49_002017, partial [Saguinus oedipus]
CGAPLKGQVISLAPTDLTSSTHRGLPKGSVPAAACQLRDRALPPHGLTVCPRETVECPGGTRDPTLSPWEAAGASLAHPRPGAQQGFTPTPCPRHSCPRRPVLSREKPAPGSPSFGRKGRGTGVSGGLSSASTRGSRRRGKDKAAPWRWRAALQLPGPARSPLEGGAAAGASAPPGAAHAPHAPMSSTAAPQTPRKQAVRAPGLRLCSAPARGPPRESWFPQQRRPRAEVPEPGLHFPLSGPQE